MCHSMMSSMVGSQCQTKKKYKLMCHSMMSSMEGSHCQTKKKYQQGQPLKIWPCDLDNQQGSRLS